MLLAQMNWTRKQMGTGLVCRYLLRQDREVTIAPGFDLPLVDEYDDMRDA